MVEIDGGIFAMKVKNVLYLRVSKFTNCVTGYLNHQNTLIHPKQSIPDGKFSQKSICGQIIAFEGPERFWVLQKCSGSIRSGGRSHCCFWRLIRYKECRERFGCIINPVIAGITKDDKSRFQVRINANMRPVARKATVMRIHFPSAR